MEGLSELVWSRRIKFHSLVSLYRSSYSQVEKCLYVASVSK